MSTSAPRSVVLTVMLVCGATAIATSIADFLKLRRHDHGHETHKFLSIEARLALFQPARNVLDRYPREFVTNGDMPVQVGAWVDGTLKMADGTRAQPGIPVYCWRANRELEEELRNGSYHSALSDENGNFRITGLDHSMAYEYIAGGNGFIGTGTPSGAIIPPATGIHITLSHVYCAVLRLVDENGSRLPLERMSRPNIVQTLYGAEAQPLPGGTAAAIIAGLPNDRSGFGRDDLLFAFRAYELEPHREAEVRIQYPGLVAFRTEVPFYHLSEGIPTYELPMQRTDRAYGALSVGFGIDGWNPSGRLRLSKGIMEYEFRIPREQYSSQLFQEISAGMYSVDFLADGQNKELALPDISIVEAEVQSILVPIVGGGLALETSEGPMTEVGAITIFFGNKRLRTLEQLATSVRFKRSIRLTHVPYEMRGVLPGEYEIVIHDWRWNVIFAGEIEVSPSTLTRVIIASLGNADAPIRK